MKKEDVLVDRRKSPDYQQISGHVDKNLVRQFKTFCTSEDITIAEALEQAMAAYLESKGVKPQLKNSEGDNQA